MISNTAILIILVVIIILLIGGVVATITVSVVRARKLANTTIFNPKKLEVVFYRKKDIDDPDSVEYERVDIEEVYDRNDITGVALYGTDVILFYLDDGSYNYEKEQEEIEEDALEEEGEKGDIEE